MCVWRMPFTSVPHFDSVPNVVRPNKKNLLVTLNHGRVSSDELEIGNRRSTQAVYKQVFPVKLCCNVILPFAGASP